MQSKLKSAIKGITGERYFDKVRMLKRVSRSPVFYARYALTNPIGKLRLSEIGKYYGTDKVDKHHTFNKVSYLDIYEKYFDEFRDKGVSFLEIGVNDGASLRTWKSYFQHGRIYGIDIDPRCRELEEARIQIEIGSQDDINFLRHCFGGEEKFDIVVDDGSHVNGLTIASFECLFYDRLKSGGLYIIEDLRMSYQKIKTGNNAWEKWPGMKYNDPSKIQDNDRKDMDNFFLEKIKKLDHLQGNIQSLHFWSMICVVKKV